MSGRNPVSVDPAHRLASTLVEIRQLDAAALADDARAARVLRLNRRAELLGREQTPFWTVRGVPRRVPLGRQRRAAGAVRAPTTATGWSAPPCCGRSCSTTPTRPGSSCTSTRPPGGAASAGRWSSALEQPAKDDGRALILTDAKIPYGERETHAYRRFAEACGFELSNVEVVRHLRCRSPTSRSRLARRGRGAPRGLHDRDVRRRDARGARRVAVPAARPARRRRADRRGGLRGGGRDARAATPSGAPPTKAMGRALYETVALTPDGRSSPSRRWRCRSRAAPDVFQWGTFVHREHRGHRLGLATKAANLRAVQAARPDLHAGHHPERRDQRLHGRDQQADGLRGRSRTRRSGQAPLTSRSRLPRPQLGALPQVVGVDHRRRPGSRRSAGGRRGSTTGCPSGGTWTAPSTIPSLGSSRRGPARAPSPSSRSPTRFDSAPTTYAAAQSRSSASSANQSARGPGRPAAVRAAAAAGCRAAPAAPPARPTGSAAPSVDPRRADPGEGVGGPRAEDRLDRDPAGDGDVGPDARSAAAPSRSRPPGGTHSARSQPRSAPSTSTGTGAPVTATQTPSSAVEPRARPR